MARDVLAKRLAFILTKLNNGERFTLEELALEFSTTTKTIYRDLVERFCYLPIQKEGKQYYLAQYALGKLNFEDIKSFATISGIKSLYPTLSNQFLTEVLDNKIHKAFLIKNSGFEDIESKKEDFAKLSRAVINHEYITFTYNNKNKKVEPYKLINANGIWYLCANDDNKIKTYTLSKIKHLNLSNETFKPNAILLKEIEKDEINWFSNELKEVILKIDNGAKEYFLRKKALANMQILEENEKYFIVSTKIAFDDELLHLVKYWIPYIEIVSPIDLAQKLNTILNAYLDKQNML
jgi:predicted DNA-binding transcriptional regulator YafY